MTARIPTVVASFALALLACSDDPADPARGYCESTGDCAIEGIDLAIVEAEIDFDADQPFRAAVDAHVVEPGDEVIVRALVVNRGSEPSVPGRLSVVDDWRYAELAVATVPVLDPGEQLEFRLNFDWAPLVWHDTLVVLRLRLGTESDRWHYEDASSENNYRGSREDLGYHPLVPIISVEWTSPDTVRVLEPALGSVAFTNHSPFVRAPALVWHICYVDEGVACDDVPDGPVINTVTIEAGETKVAVAAFLVPPTGIGLDAPADQVGAGMCAFAGGDWESDRACVLPGHSLWVRPNLEAACNPELLTPPDTVTIETGSVCYLDDEFTRYHVAAFDAGAGTEYRLERIDGGDLWTRVLDDRMHQIAEIRTADGAGTFVAPETRRYFLLTHLGMHGDVSEVTIALEIVE